MKKVILLVIEDEEMLLRAMYLYFHQKKYTVATTGDAETGLFMAERLQPDIILLDLLLPGMDGFAFLSKIKSHTTLKDIPVLVLSNLSNPQDIERAKSLGAADFALKSETDLSVIDSKIKKILTKKQ